MNSSYVHANKMVNAYLIGRQRIRMEGVSERENKGHEGNYCHEGLGEDSC